MKGLWRRVTTAVVFVSVMLIGLFTGPYTFSVLFLLITAACLWEFFSITLDLHTRRDQARKIIGVLLGVLPLILLSVLNTFELNDPKDFIQIASLFFSPFVFFIFIYELYSNSKAPFVNIGFIILGLFYIGIPFALLSFIAFDEDNFYNTTVLGLLLLTWVNDSGAYLIGSKIGKTPLFPRISPNKTWEGSIAGIITTMALGVALGYIFPEVAIKHWIVLAIIVSIFGTLGDLVESMLKRNVGVKDSGGLLPGHGGVLDRFDGFIFIIPFAAAYLLYIR